MSVPTESIRLNAEIRHWIRSLESITTDIDLLHTELHDDADALPAGILRDALQQVLVTVHLLRGQSRLALTKLNTINTPGGGHHD